MMTNCNWGICDDGMRIRENGMRIRENEENWIDSKENELVLKVLDILYNYTDGSFYTNMLQSF